MRAAHTRPALASSKMAADAARSHPAARPPASESRPQEAGAGRDAESRSAKAARTVQASTLPAAMKRLGMLEASRRLRPGTPPAPQKLGGWGAGARGKGKKKKKRAAAHPGPSAHPAPEMTFRSEAEPLFKVDSSSAVAGRLHKVSGIALDTPSHGLAVTLSRL